MKRFGFALAFVALSAAGLQAREWTDVTGKIKENADYVGQKDGSVILRKPDGKLATVPLDKLSPADREFVASQPATLVGGRPQQPAVTEKPAAASDRFSQAIEANPNDPTAYYTRGMARLNQGAHGEALSDFNKALELKPNFAAAYDGLGVALSKSKKPIEALAAFDKAIELDPEMASAYRHRGDNVEALWDSPQGKEMLKQRAESYREKYEKARASNLTNTPWQPLNTTSGNVTPTLGQFRQVDYLRAREIEDAYGGGVGGDGVAIGGGGVSVGYGGVKIVNGGLTVVNPGTTVVGNPALAVYPEEVVQGQTITLVANPSQLEMPVQLGPNGKPLGRNPKGAPREPVYAVDFYRDVDGDGIMNGDSDEYLATDQNSKDGFSVEISTAAFPPGNQAYFAVGRGKQPTGVPSTYGQAAEAVKNAIETERGIAEKSKAASEGGGYTTEDAQKLLADQDRIGQTTQKMASAFAQTSPEAANALNSAAKAMLAARTRLSSATKYPGEKSVPIATAAAGKAEEAANLLDQAYASLSTKAQGEEEGKASPSPAAPAGGAAVASGMVKPGQGGPAPPANNYAGGPGGDGNDDGRDDDDDVDVARDDDDDDRIVVRDTIDRALGYIEEDDYDRAVVEYDRYLVDDPDNDDVLLHRADAYVNRGSYDYAVRDYDQLVSLGVETAELYYNRGCAHLAAGRIKEAIADFDASISLDETRNLAYTNRGSAYARLGDYVTAIANFDAAIKIEPRDSLAYRNRALANKKLGNLDLYEQDFARAKEFSAVISAE